MKGFTRMETRFSLCGLNCDLCSMHLGGYCPGCGGVTTPYRDDTINPDARQADDE